MGSNARATICLGTALEEEGEYPWKDDMEEWWLKINGYEPPFQLFDAKGEYLNGKKPPKDQIDAYYNHKFKFKKDHPLPVEVVYYGSGYDDSSCKILAVCGTEKETDWCSPLKINPNDIAVDVENLKKFKEFCKTYLNIEDEPKWLLSAYYG